MEPPEHPKLAPLNWEPRPARALVRLAAPITLSNLSFAVMGLVDTTLIAGLGASELAGVGLGFVITNGVMGFGFGLLRGVKVLLAQSRGSGDERAARVYIGAGLLVGLWLGLGALLLGELAALFVPRFTASPEAGVAARTYIAVRSLGAPIVVGYVALREARYGLGDTRSALVVAVIGNLVHALLDYVALYELRWGVAGAAGANLASFCLQAGLLAWLQAKEGVSFGARERAAQWDVVRAGAFTGLQWALEIGAITALSLLLAGLGDREMAAHQMAVQLVAFSFLPALAIAEGASILSAQAVGRDRLALVQQVGRAARKVALSYAGLCTLVFVAGGRLIAEAMTSDPGLRVLAGQVFLAAAVYQLFEALSVAGHGVLRGVGGQRFSALVALGCAWICTPLLGFVFTRWLGLGAAGGFMARAVEMAAAASLVWWHIENKGWLPAARDARRAVIGQLHAKA